MGRNVLGSGRFAGPTGAGPLNGLVTGAAVPKPVVYAQTCRAVGNRAASQVGRRLLQLGLRKAGSRIAGKILTGSSAWKKAFLHIAEHFGKDALLSKPVHAVFRGKYCSQAALEPLIQKAATKPSRRALTQATVHGNPIGRWVVLLEREFPEEIGDEITRKVVQGMVVDRSTPCKILRIIVDLTGRPITAYPVAKFF